MTTEHRMDSRPARVLSISLVMAMVVIFVADMLTMAGFAHGMLYVLVVLIALLSGRRRLLIATATISVVLILVGLSLSPPPPESFPVGYVAANRGVSILIVVVACLLALARLQQSARLLRARQDLEASDRMLKMASKVAGVGGWTIENDPPKLHWTEEVHRIHGSRPGETPSFEQAIEFYPPDYREQVRDAVGRCLEEGTAFDEEWRITNSAGDLVWVRAVGRPTLDAQGAIIGAHGAFMNIEQSRRIVQRLTTTLESITDAFFLLNREWCFTFVNARAEALLKRSREDLLTRVIWTEFPEALGSIFEEQYRQAIRDNTSVAFEAFYPPLDLWFEVHAYPSEEGLAVYFQDITRKRRSEDQLRLLESAISRINDVVLITEADPLDEPGPRILFANDAFERMTGYSRNEVIGKSPRFLQGPETCRKELDRIRRALEGAQPVRSQMINYTRDEQPFRSEIDIVPLLGADGERQYFVAVQRDLTERLDIEEQLRQAQRLEAVGQLTGGIAHDFNNLLTVILGNAELLREELADEALNEIAAMVVKAAERGAELTQRLLAFARRQALEPRTVDVSRLIDGMVDMLSRTLGGHIDIRIAHGSDVWLAFVDEGQLESCLLNLCLNARDAMDGGGLLMIETANVHLDQQYADSQEQLKPGDYVMLAVSDGGRGIAAADLGRVFEPFFTTKESGKGTGLGLSMIYGFIKQSSGHIKIDSEPGEGTTVRVYLPRSIETSALPPLSRADNEPESGDETILLVEDDALVRNFACNRLRELGYQVLVAENGPAALVLVEMHPEINLLFTDVVMPGGLSGRQLADQAQAMNPALKVLYTSGYTENAIVHHGRLDPEVALLSKPYRRSELGRKIRAVLAQPMEMPS
jgi:PAS domain S-box-containing protein